MNKHSITVLLLFLLSSFSVHSQTQKMSEEGITYGHETFELMVEVYHRNSRRPLDDVMLYLYEMPENKMVATALTSQGQAGFRINSGKEYMVKSCKRLFVPGGVKLFNCYENEKVFCVNGAFAYDFMAAGGEDRPLAFLTAQMAIDSITIGKTFKMDNVYYDLNKATLRHSSKKELNKLYELLMQYPTMVVELASHTDSRGSMEYNERLSSNRAISCYEYLLGKGIESKRIIPKGYGEVVLTNHCADGVKCSGIEHQKNRRTEFTVLSFEGQDCPGMEVEEVSAR